ncbi:Heterokaryon incompatibility protein [Colletotrichum asianum]
MRVLQAYIAFALILSLLYEPLRDDGVFGAIADSTIFRVISPKLVEPPDCADETIYKPISREKEIRLLVLEPGGPGDELKCHLIHAQLSWRTRYEALSYVWGDGTVTRPLSCSGRTETVHINLHDALSDLRLSNRERILWTDRLCIHQSHDGEKTTQIKLMGDIYSQASQVLIYLGKMDSSVEGAMKYIFQDRSAYKIPDRAAVIINLLRRPWFQRTWVFQEAVLAKRAQVICGQQSVPWTILEGLVQSMTIEQTFGRDIPAYRSMDRIVSGVFLMTAVRSARHLEWTTFCRIFGCIVSQGLVDQELFSRLSLELLDLILDTRSLLCTKSEDKIFSLLGVTSQDIGSKYLAQDSSLSPGDVFRIFVLWEIFHNSSLRALGCSSDKPGSQYSSPSWVPNFERLDPQTGLTGKKNRVKFNASAGLPMEVWASDEETVLHVKGRIVDTLHTIGKRSTSAPDTFGTVGKGTDEYQLESLSHLGINKHMIEEARDIYLAATHRLARCRDPAIVASIEKRDLEPRRADGKLSWMPFLRSLVCDRTGKGRVPETQLILRDVGSFVRQTLEISVVPEYFLQLQEDDRMNGMMGLRAMLAFTESRRFAATDIGLIGYVPMRAKRGDLVCILYGSEVPFVVRKEAGGKYAIVGECYIHGIMDGQALKMRVHGNEDEVFSFI